MDRPELRAFSAELRAARVLQPGERLHSARWELHAWNTYEANVIGFFQASSIWWSVILSQATPVFQSVAEHKLRKRVIADANLGYPS